MISARMSHDYYVTLTLQMRFIIIINGLLYTIYMYDGMMDDMLWLQALIETESKNPMKFYLR